MRAGRSGSRQPRRRTWRALSPRRPTRGATTSSWPTASSPLSRSASLALVAQHRAGEACGSWRTVAGPHALRPSCPHALRPRGSPVPYLACRHASWRLLTSCHAWRCSALTPDAAAARRTRTLMRRWRQVVGLQGAATDARAWACCYSARRPAASTRTRSPTWGTPASRLAGSGATSAPRAPVPTSSRVTSSTISARRSSPG